MQPAKTTARIAGLLYLLLITSGFFYLKYVPSKLIDWDNPAVTFFRTAFCKNKEADQLHQ